MAISSKNIGGPINLPQAVPGEGLSKCISTRWGGVFAWGEHGGIILLLCYNKAGMNGPQEHKSPLKPPQGILTWIRARWVSLITLLLVVAIIVGVFYLHHTHPELLDELSRYGYLGGFLISILLNATIVLPTGNFLVLAALATMVPSPTLLGLVGGLGAGIGEMTGYLAGYSGRAMVGNSNRWTRLEGWVNRWGVLAIFCLSIVPFAFDIVGIIAGVLRLSFWKFFLACWWGRSVLYVAICWAGVLGWEALINFLG